MANITLSELHIAGSELFQDAETFLTELSDVDTVSGGFYDDSTGYSSDSGVSDISSLTKLAEAFVYTYSIGHVTFLAKSYSHY